MTDILLSVPSDDPKLPSWVEVPAAQVTGIPDSPDDIGAATAEQGARADSAVQPTDLPAFGTAATTDADDYATAEQGALADATKVEQVTLTAPLAYALPVGTPANTVHRVTFTQDGVGGHTVTYDGAPVTVDLTAGASTTVELHPVGAGHAISYPVTNLDAQVSALAEDGGSALGASLSSTYATWAMVEPNGSRTIIIGDSIDSAAQGWYAYFSIGSGKIGTIRNAGVAGDTTAMMLARIQADVLDYSPDVVVLGASTNDQGQGIAEATTRANIETMVEMVRQAGATPVLRTTPPADSAGLAPFNTAKLRREAVQRHNAWLKGFATITGIDVLDIYQSVVDPATGGYLAGITSDGIHPTQAGSKAIADYLLALPLPVAWKGGFAFARAVAESGNMIVNGVFVGDTNADGLADSWAKLSGTPTYSLTAAATGISGNWQRITGADATNVIIGKDITTGYSTGDVLEICGRVRTSGTAAALVRLSPWGSTTMALDLLASTTQAVDGVFSGRLTVPADLTKLRFQIQTGGAAGWIECAECAIRNLTALGLA